VVNGRQGVEVELRPPVVAAGAAPRPAGPPHPTRDADKNGIGCE
jgi:hypothetical protein